MDTTHDVVALGARSLLADLGVDAPSRTRLRHRDALQGLDRLVAEHVRFGPLEDPQAVPVFRRREMCTRAFSLIGTLLTFGYAWGDLFPVLLDVHLLAQDDDGEEPTAGTPLGADALSAGESFLVQIARSHLARLADGVDPMSGLDYDEALDVLDGLYPPFTVPGIVPVAILPRVVSRDVVVECVRQLSWHGVDPAGLLRVRDLLDATWDAEVRGLAVVGGAR
ncbi:hypothetical protein Xcel_0858 [Xylanimonas cellulosilytica DSM 15894]|uniref:Uncharacterized protein n=1 Tax=Xylanimonas cellulosilytica (strain DSM 15894 / JCM 12276 / CECT 5975 / KCTC 9989 / LMG 20990 / NBRC 107835 / XIL07) TaxID=446471 RepID=D1BY48_XYLCX|nr:hypothetical protein [Xylanimonas cellulosilytica]ACZ29891.1 hypothetical protein Xcel_0858 [Xylanimonas cellulosilytica DSM 15894]